MPLSVSFGAEYGKKCHYLYKPLFAGASKIQDHWHHTWVANGIENEAFSLFTLSSDVEWLINVLSQKQRTALVLSSSTAVMSDSLMSRAERYALSLLMLMWQAIAHEKNCWITILICLIVRKPYFRFIELLQNFLFVPPFLYLPGSIFECRHRPRSWFKVLLGLL